jgi:hypothetical protein
MNIENFWNVIEQCKDCMRPEFKLQRILVGLSMEEVKEFQRHFDTLATNACRFDIHAAARLLNGGCDAREFSDFRHGLIVKGRAVYEAALKNPDHLHTLWGQRRINDDVVHYVALGVYAARLGGDWDEASYEIYSDFSSERDIYIDGTLFEFPDIDSWDLENEQENWKHLPRLSELYYGSLYSAYVQWVNQR